MIADVLHNLRIKCYVIICRAEAVVGHLCSGSGQSLIRVVLLSMVLMLHTVVLFLEQLLGGLIH
jgi:hypothetical protein